MRTFIRIVSFLVKLAVKFLLLPIMVGLTIIHCVFSLAVEIVTYVFNLIGLTIIFIAIFSAGFALDPVKEVWRMLAIGVGLCIIPMFIEWIAIDLALINLKLKSWLLT